MNFKKGDRIKVVADFSGQCKRLGDEATINRVYPDGVLDIDFDDGDCLQAEAEELCLVTKESGGEHMTTKYYRVIKDHPLWEVGAILSDEDSSSDNYAPIEDIWNKVEKTETYRDGKQLVENQPEFYERVYKDKLDKLIFYTRSEMKKVYEKFKK